MGPDLGTLCHELQNDLVWIGHKWNEFQELFGGALSASNCVADRESIRFRVGSYCALIVRRNCCVGNATLEADGRLISSTNP
jgi:hypothetical protein